ncbi:MAG: mycothiol conjugate amidase Mca [Acidimicrobiales bacterium]
MNERLCLLAVHAHPDDEASKGAGTAAKYHAAGVHTVLVTCTGGEEGDILNPAMDTPEVRADLAAVRARELARSVAVIGYDQLELLGYKDSGMAGTEANKDPSCFGAAPIEESLGKLVAIIRRERPQVIIAYGEDHSRYPHPDHIRAHEIGLGAFDAAGDASRYLEAGEPFVPLKLYYVVWSKRRIVDTHEKFLELGLESPFDEKWLEGPEQDDVITTSIDLSGCYEDVRREALLAHATQIDPTSRFWFGLPPEVARTVYPFDDFQLARSRVESVLPERDLFAGIVSRRADAGT